MTSSNADGQREGGPHDDVFDEEGYDETQRAEIIEATSAHPGDGVIIVDLDPDMGEDDLDDDDDALEGEDDDVET